MHQSSIQSPSNQRYLWAGLAALICGCAGATVGPAPDRADASIPVDAWRAVDLSRDANARGEEGGLPDAETPDGSLDDAPACMCASPDECGVSACLLGACVRVAVPDGTACVGPDDLCVDGACALRGCGDGYREVDPTRAEACDDGNGASPDLCDDVCLPTPLVIAGELGEVDRAHAGVSTVATDTLGTSLLAFTRSDSSGGAHAMAVRFDRHSVPLGPPFELSALALSDPSEAVAVAALDEGFVVALAVRGTGAGVDDVMLVYVDVDGIVTAPVSVDSAHHAPRRSALIARAGDAGLVAWLEWRGKGYELRARSIDAGGRTTGPTTSVSGPGIAASDPVVAGVGDVLVFAWTTLGGSSPLSVVLRRLGGDGTAVDEAALPVSTGSAGNPSVARIDDANAMVAWTSFEDDAHGDVLAARVGPTGPLGAIALIATDGTRPESHPSVASRDGQAIVAFEIGSGGIGRTVDVALASPDGALPPDLDAISALLGRSTSVQRSASLSGDATGLWILWDDEAPELVGAAERLIAFRVFSP
jgi:hypothetical protein